VRTRGVTKDVDAVYSLMDLRFAPDAEPPAGVVTLVFSGEAKFELKAECLDVTLADIGPAWPTRRRPDHEKKRS
ncbi:MAG: DUF2948 family protein, partial [Hyphomonadaceae bacterium]